LRFVGQHAVFLFLFSRTGKFVSEAKIVVRYASISKMYSLESVLARREGEQYKMSTWGFPLHSQKQTQATRSGASDFGSAGIQS
jgi:hypothetical protein